MIKYSSEYPTVAPRTMPTYKSSSDRRSQPISDPDYFKWGIQETQVTLQRNIILLILHIILSPSSRQRATRKFQWWSLIISHIGLHTVYYKTLALLSSTRSLICNKEQYEQVRMIISYKSAMDSNTFLFYPTDPKIGHSQVGQAHVTST